MTFSGDEFLDSTRLRLSLNSVATLARAWTELQGSVEIATRSTVQSRANPRGLATVATKNLSLAWTNTKDPLRVLRKHVVKLFVGNSDRAKLR